MNMHVRRRALIAGLSPFFLIAPALLPDCPWAAQASPRVVPSSRSLADAPARLGEILRKIRDSNAPDLTGRGRWRDLVSQHRAGIEACTTHEAFAAAVNRLIAESGVSHFHYYTRDDWQYWHLQSAFGEDGPETELEHIGVIPQEIDGRWFVRGIMEGSPASGLDIRVGDELVLADGLSYEPVSSFRGQAGRLVELTLQRRPGVTHSVQVAPVKESLYRALQRAVTASIRTIEHEGRVFAYMHGWTLLGRGREYQKLAALQADVDGLILDYRDGVGGTWQTAENFLVGPDGGPLSDTRPPVWIKPVVILTGDGTRSAKEIVVHRIKRTRRAPLIGEPTPGHVISVGSIEEIGEDGLLMLPGHRFSLEGKPTQPDYPMKREIPYSAGADPQLDFARKLLSRMAEEQASLSRSHGSSSN